MDRFEVGKLLALTCSLYPNFVASEATPEAWFFILSECDVKEAAEAIRELTLSGREFAPNPGQIYAQIRRKKIDKARVFGSSAALPEPPMDREKAKQLFRQLERKIGTINGKKLSDIGH